MKISRIAPALCLLACLTGGAAQPALAASDCSHAAMSKLRYQSVITYSCPTALVGTPSFQVTRVSSGANVPTFAPTVNGSTASVTLNATLGSAATYQVIATIDDGAGDQQITTTWKTMAPPAHPKLSIEYILAIPDPAAVHDMLQRIDGANLFAPPTAGRIIDASNTTKLNAKQIETALNGRQAALVVGGDADYTFPGALGAALAWFASRGHGVVTAGQTHWSDDPNGDWHHKSTVGLNTAWDHVWDIYGDGSLITADRIHGGPIAPSTIHKHFVTAGLKSFNVIGPSSGEAQPHFGISSNILAYFPKTKTGLFNMFPQAFLTVRQVNASRLVDLGYRPWSSALPGGGFNPAVSPGGSLLARSLWWSMNRIAPTKTRFTTKPPSRSAWATVSFGFAATDPDLDHAGALKFRYRIDGGKWKWAVANAVVFYNLAKGRYHTVSVYAVDSGGNRDPKTASYRFLVNSSARS